MRRWDLMRYVFTIGMAAALLVGCGSQPLIGAPGAMPQSGGIGPTYSMRQRQMSGSSYKVVYNFAGASDGARPLAGLINVNGTLYGTTVQGGGEGCYKSFGCGTVFSVTPTGQETVLHAFTGGSDGANPKAGLIDVNGTLYGTTFHGGDTKCNGRSGVGCGTVFSITPSGAEIVLHGFTGPPDGAWPAAGLRDVNGTLYGTTAEGGTPGGCRLGHPKIGCGTVYSMSPSGSENVLFRLVGPTTGSYAAASLIDLNGTLYGTTEYGGGHGQGSVYTVSPSGSGKLLYHFTYKEDKGEAPAAALIDVKGLLYGTLSSGGAHGRGTVYSITTSGTVNVVYSFGSPGSTDGWYPSASLIDMHGTLYGTTLAGGVKGCFSTNGGGCGTVFSVTTGGKEQLLHTFGGSSSDGYYPSSNLINVNGTLYGTTANGGTHGAGTVYAITP
jgi:uncharacterized repeat protein (TIGR03803 family)